MTSKPIYFCVYRITNIVEKKHYYGYKSSVIHPSKVVGVTYFSSSKGIYGKQFIADQKENPQNYKYKIVQIFNSKDEALSREIRLHTKFDVKNHSKFYNKSNQTSTGFDTTGKFIAIDKEGNTFMADINDPRRLTGEITSNIKNKVFVRTDDGTIIITDVNDKRILLGELSHININKVAVVDHLGNKFSVSVDDDRFKSGELKSITSTRIYSDKSKNSTKEKKIQTWKNKIESGYTFSDSHRTKLSSSGIGRIVSEQTIQKLKNTINVNGSHKGTKNSRSKYIYHTPWGIFDSPEALNPHFTTSRMKHFL